MTGKQAAKIVDAIVQTGWSRERIAAKLECTTSSFDKWATGRVTPRPRVVRCLEAVAKKRGVA